MNPSVTEVETLKTTTLRGYVTDEVIVHLSDDRKVGVLIWYYDQRDGFPAEVEYEIWDESFKHILQPIQVIGGTGFDYNLIAVFAEANSTEVPDTEHEESALSDWDRAWNNYAYGG